MHPLGAQSKATYSPQSSKALQSELN